MADVEALWTYVLRVFIVLYICFGIILATMGIAMLADYYMGTMVGFLNMFEITIGSALLLASGVFLLCTAVIAWFALISEDFRLVTVMWIAVVITFLVTLGASITLLTIQTSVDQKIENYIQRMVEQYDSRAERSNYASKFLDIIQQYLRCCGAESANDYRYREIPESCKSEFASGVRAAPGCKYAVQLHVHYWLRAIGWTGIGFSLVQLLAVIASGFIWWDYRQYSLVDEDDEEDDRVKRRAQQNIVIATDSDARQQRANKPPTGGREEARPTRR